MHPDFLTTPDPDLSDKGFPFTFDDEPAANDPVCLIVVSNSKESISCPTID